jgi:hypothetical protein
LSIYDLVRWEDKPLESGSVCPLRLLLVQCERQLLTEHMAHLPAAGCTLKDQDVSTRVDEAPGHLQIQELR